MSITIPSPPSRSSYASPVARCFGRPGCKRPEPGGVLRAASDRLFIVLPLEARAQSHGTTDESSVHRADAARTSPERVGTSSSNSVRACSSD